jgi:hypothetical protein
MSVEATLRQEWPRIPHQTRLRRHYLRALGALVALYLVVAYVALPFAWRRFASKHPALESLPRITRTANGIHGDPVNVALVGSEDDLKRAMLAAGWRPADPLTLASCLRIARGTVLRRAYDSAPVSSLYLWNRKQDLAFEQPVGHDPRQRHHVRFWRSQETDEQGRPLWAGAATYDRKVGFSHTTGQVTHHIDANVDAERDKLMSDLARTGHLTTMDWWPSFQVPHEGRNGGGDLWHTDGRLSFAVLDGARAEHKD